MSSTPTSPTPIIFSPALPSELLTFILNSCSYPATLIVCSTPEDFDDALREETLLWHEHQAEALRTVLARLEANEDFEPPPEVPDPAWLRSWSPLEAIRAKKIRVIFAPDPDHLRAFLAIFPLPDPEESIDLTQGTGTPASSPSETPEHQAMGVEASNVLFVYNFLGSHRDTKEWNAQGLGKTTSTLVESAWNNGLQPVIVEPRMYVAEGGWVSLDIMLAQELPILTLQDMKALARELEEEDDGAWITETVPVQNVLGRWFQFGPGPWDDYLPDEEQPDDMHPDETDADEASGNEAPWDTSIPSDETPWDTGMEEDEQYMQYGSS